MIGIHNAHVEWLLNDVCEVPFVVMATVAAISKELLTAEEHDAIFLI